MRPPPPSARRLTRSDLVQSSAAFRMKRGQPAAGARKTRKKRQNADAVQDLARRSGESTQGLSAPSAASQRYRRFRNPVPNRSETGAASAGQPPEALERGSEPGSTWPSGLSVPLTSWPWLRR